MASEDEIDEEALEIIEVRLEIDLDALHAYLVANSDFPAGPMSGACAGARPSLLLRRDLAGPLLRTSSG